MNAEEFSKWNFQNKTSLLLAGKLSLNLRDEDAEIQYDIAIKAAQSSNSNFIHEQGKIRHIPIPTFISIANRFRFGR
jgi:hypothetical protein